MFRYRHAGSDDNVRAPQTRIPRPGKARMQLIPTGFSRSCSLRVIWVSSSIAPRTISLAGALCTPRVSSLRPQIPAMNPEGGRYVPPPVLIHGQYSAANLESYPALSTRHSLICCALSPGRRVEDGHPVAHQLAVGDHGHLHRLHGVQVDGAALVCGQQIRHADHGDLVDSLQTRHAAAFFDVADVVIAGQPRRRARHRNGRRRREGDLHAGVQLFGGLARRCARASPPAMPR